MTVRPAIMLRSSESRFSVPNFRFSKCFETRPSDCNDLFSHFEQQILFLEKQTEATDPTMDRHGHDGPSQGLVSKHLENLKLGTENRLSELRNRMAGRTITGVTDRHRLFREIECLNLATTCRTDRRRHDGPSQVA